MGFEPISDRLRVYDSAIELQAYINADFCYILQYISFVPDLQADAHIHF